MGEKYFSCKTDKAPYSYECGEKITFDIFLREDHAPASCHSIKWEITADFGFSESCVCDGKDGHITLSASLDKPGFIYVKAFALNEKGDRKSTRLNSSH